VKSETKDDIGLLILATLASGFGLASMFGASHVLAWVVIAVTDLYLFCILLFAAIVSDSGTPIKEHNCLKHFFPRFTAGLFVFALLMLAIVSGFAGLYVGAGVFQSSKTPHDAFYISFLTMGFNDPVPASGYGQRVVIAQVASGISLLSGGLSLLISRISTFK
jgi:hypothetical protein